MGKVSDLARELPNHAIDDHTRGCGGRMYSCECGYDGEGRTSSHARRRWGPRAPGAPRNLGGLRKKEAAEGGGLRSVHGLRRPTVGVHA